MRSRPSLHLEFNSFPCRIEISHLHSCLIADTSWLTSFNLCCPYFGTLGLSGRRLVRISFVPGFFPAITYPVCRRLPILLAMVVDIRHGLTGEIAMQIETKSDLSGWEVMDQVAAHQGLMTPYQVIVNPGRASKQTSPLHILPISLAADCREIQIIVRPLQYPTAAQYHRLMEALYRKDAGEVAKFLGRGLDLTLLAPPGGHTSALLTMAMLKDHDIEPYTSSSSGFLLKYPCQNACLTFLLLQAKVDPNILPPKQQPTTMIGLAVALKNQALVQLLLDAEAEVHPDEATVPPLTIAVLHQNEGIVRALLTALADPWRSAPVGALLDCPWSKVVRPWTEPVSAMMVAAMQSPEQKMVGILMNAPTCMGSWEDSQPSHLAMPVSMAYSEPAMKLFTKVVEDYPRRTGPHRPCIGPESLHWRKLMAGLYLPKLPPGWLQSEDISAANCFLLRQTD